MISLTIPGEPIAKHRPRFARRGKFVTTYSDQETEEGKFIAHVLHQMGDKKPMDGPLTVHISCWKKRPKGHYGTGRNVGTLKKSAPKYPTTKPDTDNYVKFILDCLNSIAFHDDSQVIDIIAQKRYVNKLDSGTKINIMEAV